MSDHSSSASKAPKSPRLITVAAFLIPAAIIVAFACYVAGATKDGAGSVTNERAVAERIQKVGSVELLAADRPAKSGEEVYKAQCAACHATGAVGSPKLGDAGAWGPRIKTGFDALVTSALKGKGNMSAQGGGVHSDLEVARAVAYMANAAGAKFEEPKAPTPAAAPAAAAPAADAPKK